MCEQLVESAFEAQKLDPSLIIISSLRHGEKVEKDHLVEILLNLLLAQVIGPLGAGLGERLLLGLGPVLVEPENGNCKLASFTKISCTKALTTYAPSAGAFATPTSGFSRTSRNQKAMEANRWTFGALNILQSQHTFLRTPSSQLVSNHVSNPCKDQIHTWESIIFFNYATGIIFR